MNFIENNFYHIYNRGINSQNILLEEENYFFFLKKIKKELSSHCNILAYCLMPNHFHLLIYTGYFNGTSRQTTPSGQTTHDDICKKLPRKIGTLQISYTRAINKRYDRSGNLFQQKVKAKNLLMSKVSYLPETCFHYIHQNPLKARLVAEMIDWPYSSYREYDGKSEFEICNLDLAKELLAINFSNLKGESLKVINNDLLV